MQAAPIGEEKQIRVRRGHTQVAHEILTPSLHPPGSLTSPALGTVKGKGIALDIPKMGKSDDHILFDDEVFVGNPIHCFDNLRSSGVAKSFHHLTQFIHDHFENPGITAQQIFQVGDLQPQLFQLGDDLLPLHGGQGAQAHFENRLGLALGEPKTLFQLGARRSGIRRSPNQRDDLVQVVQGHHEALEDVSAFLRPGQIVDRPANHDFLPEFDEMTERLLDGECLGTTADESQQVHGKRRLQGRHLVELVEDYVFGGVAFEFNDNAHSLAVGLVTQVRDALDAAIPHEVGHSLQEK